MKKAITDFLISFLIFFIAVLIQWVWLKFDLVDASNFFNNYISLGVAYIISGVVVHGTLFGLKVSKKMKKE